MVYPIARRGSCPAAHIVASSSPSRRTSSGVIDHALHSVDNVQKLCTDNTVTLFILHCRNAEDLVTHLPSVARWEHILLASSQFPRATHMCTHRVRLAQSFDSGMTRASRSTVHTCRDTYTFSHAHKRYPR